MFKNITTKYYETNVKVNYSIAKIKLRLIILLQN